MCQSQVPACLFSDAGLTRSLTVDAPTVLMMWSNSCRVKTTRRRDGMLRDGDQYRGAACSHCIVLKSRVMS